jgi:hypothetical protein
MFDVDFIAFLIETEEMKKFLLPQIITKPVGKR